MPALSGLALTQEQIIEILSLYATAMDPIDAVSEAPGWCVIGGFPMPTNADIRLDVMGSVSDESLVMTTRLYDITPDWVGPVNGSEAQTTSTTGAEVFSGIFTLLGGHLYQVQSQVVGNVGTTFFGTVLRAAPAGI
jgi:hypothetical protein